MKKIMIIALAFFGLQAMAQDKKSDRGDMRKERMEKLEALTPDEIATIHTKQMTLRLDLTDAQQKQIKSINLEEAKLRKSIMEERKGINEGERKEMTKDERVAKMNERLARQIAMKGKMKEILNADQYEKWEVSRERGGRDGRRQYKRRSMKRNKQ